MTAPVLTPTAIPVLPPAPLRRLLLVLLTLATGGGLTLVWWDLLSQNGITGFDIVQVSFFAINVLWISLFFWTAVAGWVRVMLNGRTPGLVLPLPLTAGVLAPELHGDNKIAILIPVYNEDPEAVFGNLIAMYKSLERLGQLHPFHFFVISDTTDPDIWVREEMAWSVAIAETNGKGRIFYRRRPKNTARKAGNVADFCTRWGAQYEHMLVLDADSLLTAETIVQLARTIRLNPKTGILQGLPTVIGSNSFYARSQQFAVRLYGPMLGAGLNTWHLGEGNYWGHNAIINTSFFTNHCGLPALPGKPPFGGHILSHDFVEAALIRRAGWQVWLLSEVEGCYEQVPPTMIDSAKRDRRWVQGNLQHSRIILARGLHMMSRGHIAMGILSYGASLLCLMFLLVGLASAIYQNLVPPDYFGDSVTLFPTWPIFDGDLALSLLAITLGMLTLPKILAGISVMGRDSKKFGGRLNVWGSILVEHLFTALVAPILMLVHSGFIFDVFMGRDSGWGKQSRGDSETTWGEAFVRHRGHMVFGLMIGAVSWFYAPGLFWWLSPVLIGLLFAMPLSVYSSRVSVGQWFRRRGLLVTAEELVAPPEWLEARAAEAKILAQLPEASGPLGNIENVLRDNNLNALHISLLPEKSLELADPDELVKARRKLELRLQGSPTPLLSAAEKLALLYDAETLANAPARFA